MAGKKVNQTPTYEEFEPFCKWQRNEDRDILELQLQGFKKEQLKVQISNHGILKISGQRQLDPSTHTKFYKEISVPSTKYDTHAINAKFVSGNLIITLPKMKTSVPEIHEKTSAEPMMSKTESTAGSGGAKELQTPTPGGNASTEFQFQGRKQRPMGSRLAKVAVSLAATAAAVAVLVAYVVYMYKATVDVENDD